MGIEARHIESKRFNLPRLKSELRFPSQGGNFQDNDSTECKIPQSENAGDDTEILPSNHSAVADAAYDDDAEDDHPRVEHSFGVNLEEQHPRFKGTAFRTLHPPRTRLQCKLANCIREPTIDPTEGEDITTTEMMNPPYRPYPATYSLMEVPL